MTPTIRNNYEVPNYKDCSEFDRGFYQRLKKCELLKNEHNLKQAGAELGQAQVKPDDIVEVLVDVEVKELVKVQLLFQVSGWLLVGWVVG